VDIVDLKRIELSRLRMRNGIPSQRQAWIFYSPCLGEVAPDAQHAQIGIGPVLSIAVFVMYIQHAAIAIVSAALTRGRNPTKRLLPVSWDDGRSVM
jgi:hypothetical protein